MSTRAVKTEDDPEEIGQRVNALYQVADLLGTTAASCQGQKSQYLDLLLDELLSLQQSNNRLAFIEEELLSNLAIATHQLQLASKWKENIEVELASSESAVSLERKREALIRRTKDLHKEFERITEELVQPPITITELLKLKDKVAKKTEDLKVKRARLKAFQGLPPNLELARHELAQAREELTKLIQLRDRLLRSMADGVR